MIQHPISEYIRKSTENATVELVTVIKGQNPNVDDVSINRIWCTYTYTTWNIIQP